MRTIKFRAWFSASKVMIPWKEMLKHNMAIQYFEDGPGKPELMQFTGLLDKNRKEIYEGDIIQFQIPSGKLHKAEVVFYEDKLKFCKRIVGRPNKYSGLANPNKPRGRFEVIGNIYENPELLGEPNDNLKQ